MHLWIITMTLLLASCLRIGLWTSFQPQSASWTQRWHRTLTAFLVPPLLLLMTAFAMIQMGTEGVMLGIPVGKIGFVMGVGSVGWAGLVLGYLGIQGWRSHYRIRSLPSIDVSGDVPGVTTKARLLDSPTPFAGQVGFWHSELVVSRGLFTTLTPDHVKAVLTHESAHAAYRDTFWFFWLNGVRALTGWLPMTRRLWRELLLLREMRADGRAAQTVDPLLLAEALLEMVRCPIDEPLLNSVAFHSPSTAHRLEERVNALLLTEEEAKPEIPWVWVSFFATLLPLGAIALHH